MDNQDTLLTVKEAALRLRVTTRSIGRLMQKKQLASLKVGGSRRFLASDIEAYIAGRRAAEMGTNGK